MKSKIPDFVNWILLIGFPIMFISGFFIDNIFIQIPLMITGAILSFLIWSITISYWIGERVDKKSKKNLERKA